MPELYYTNAQRLGQKELRRCTAQGIYPYLTALEDFLSTEQMVRGEDLGVMTVPMEFIAGTKTSGRTSAFARNFMPLMADGTEFAGKWKNLCKAHLEEGIRDPILAYEYMNRFYVEEGNKRVSVLKFFDADRVDAHVIRVYPENKDTPEASLYYEFVEFNRLSKLNFLEFSKSGSYLQLQQCLGKEPGESWTEEERRNFASAYYTFRGAYEANGGGHLSSTVGDAMLAYIKVYGYQSLRDVGEEEVRRQVAKVWEEITLQQESPSIDVKLTPQEEKGEGLLAKVLPKSRTMKVAFIHDKTPDTSGWVYGHELGRLHVQRVFQGDVETTPYFGAMDGDPLAVIERAIDEGNTVIFTTSPRLLPASLRAAVDHPKLILLNCSLNMSHRYIRTYYARMYEAKFIIGAIAGSLAGGNPVGYICDYPIFGQVAGINAFALGVQMVNPRIKVHLEWSGTGSVAEATRRLREQGVSLISSQDLAKLEERQTSSFGLSLVTEEGQVNLAMPLWQWGVYYESLLRRIRSKSFQAEYEESSKALNYYWGMSAGVVTLHCSAKVPDGARKLAEILRSSVCSGSCEPFQGPLYAQDGRVVIEKGQSLTLQQIINMDWLADNIAGAIPAYEELNDTGKATVGIAGVDVVTGTGKEKSEKNTGGPS